VRQQVRRELLAEGKKDPVWKRLGQIPAIGPIRAVALRGMLQTTHCFRIQRRLCSYSGLGIVRQGSADQPSLEGQLQRVKKQLSLRGLHRSCSRDLKNLSKGAAIVAWSKLGPLQEFHSALPSKGRRPEMAPLTLARKIATTVSIV
jgi:Transposase IS116/IS110/IS902 family